MINTLTTYLTEGFALGLTLGTTCAATCGPMYMPYLMQKKHSVKESILNVFEISLGRFLSYIAFGMLAGGIGSAIGVILDRGWFSSLAYILFSVLLLLSAFRTHKKEKGCAVSKYSKFADRPFLFGVFTGISLCPSFFGAMTAAFDAGGVVGGASIFGSFFFGSSVFLLPFAIAGVAGNVKFFRKVATVASLLVAVYFIGKGTFGFVELTQQSMNRSPMSASNVVGAFDDTPLYILEHGKNSLQLIEAISEKKDGLVHRVTSTEALPEKCHILVDADFLENPIELRAPGRFVVVLPRNSGELSSQEYNSNIVEYLERYLFKRDDENGTFFNMASFLEKEGDHGTEG